MNNIKFLPADETTPLISYNTIPGSIVFTTNNTTASPIFSFLPIMPISSEESTKNWPPILPIKVLPARKIREYKPK